jgi:hypothetical protein
LFDLTIAFGLVQLLFDLAIRIKFALDLRFGDELFGLLLEARQIALMPPHSLFSGGKTGNGLNLICDTSRTCLAASSLRAIASHQLFPARSYLLQFPAQFLYLHPQLRHRLPTLRQDRF